MNDGKQAESVGQTEEIAIDVREVKKKFKVYLDKGSELKERLLFRSRNRYEERWVLRGISFQVKKGEAIGLIGHNGCGKSTTLKLLTRIIYPDQGTISMKGRISSLIELGAGFHPDMSGRENIYTNASIFGLTKKEIDERMDDIIAFSELEEFLDNPVRTYSSGMYMRLAFSVAINVDADILLIDEILAVGDANFQTKCFNRLREIKEKGTTIVIVSHSLGQIEQICDRSIWIHDGLVRAEGAPRDVHSEYLEYMGEKRQEILEKEKERIRKLHEEDPVRQEQEKVLGIPKGYENPDRRWGTRAAFVTEVHTYGADGVEKTVFATGDTIYLRIFYKVLKPIRNAVFGIALIRADGIHCYGTNTKIDQTPPFDLTKDGMVELVLKNVELLPCVYLLETAIQDIYDNTMDYYKDAFRFEVFSKIPDVGLFRIPHQWNGLEEKQKEE